MLAFAVLLGAVTVGGFAPFGLTAVPIVTIALLFALWQRAEKPRHAAAIGFAFGLGLFSAGATWVYIALATFGGMPAFIAALATAGFVGLLSLWPALAGYAATSFTPVASIARLFAAAAAWPIAEWLRGYSFTDFPWLSAGYSQLPGSPLAGYAPVGGVFSVSLAVAVLAALLAVVFASLADRAWPRIAMALAGAIAVAIGGAAFGAIEWTTPRGAPLAVSLVQGNIMLDEKFDVAERDRTFAIYAGLVEQSRGRLVVLPESAFAMFANDVPEDVYLQLARVATARRGDVLLGLFTTEAPLPGTDDVRYYNTVVALGSSEVQLYRKRHLVPFGERIPAKALLGFIVRNILAIPLADQTPGDPAQPPFSVAGTRVAVNICYEDAFGAELIDAARTAALLVNVTNDAWYGHSIAARQHNQISAMRALELGRPMLRATNTGITSAFGHDGREIAALPWFARGILEVTIDGRDGSTPYQRWSDGLALGLAFALFAGALAMARRR